MESPFDSWKLLGDSGKVEPPTPPAPGVGALGSNTTGKNFPQTTTRSL